MKLHWGLAGTEAAGMAQYNQSAAAITAAPTERRDRTGLCFMIGPICILDLLRRAAFSPSRLQHPISHSRVVQLNFDHSAVSPGRCLCWVSCRS